MRRRAFLRRLAVGGAALATGCVAPTPSPSATSTNAANASPSPTSAGIAAPDWDALRTRLSGTLIRPSDGAYEGARVLFNTRFDAVRPQAIARCASAEDVRVSVRFARSARVPIALRSGGHSYGGWSTGPGLVIDVGPMSGIDVQSDRITIGAGARLIDVYDAVAARGVGIAAGTCPTVGIAGLTLGGGVGVLSRAWGLTCDQLISARIVTADGELRDCDDATNADLFWALRGGGGGSFGVVTSLTFRTHPAVDLALGFLQWPWSRVSAVAAAWQAWMLRAPDGLWSTLQFIVAPPRAPQVTMHAVLTGGETELVGLFDSLIASAGAPISREEGARSYRDVMFLHAGCLGRTVAQCHLAGTTPDGILRRDEMYTAKSAIASRPMSTGAIASLTEGIDSLSTRGGGVGAVLVETLGGAVSRIARDATAFPHRDAFAVVQLGGWGASATPAGEGTTAWLRELYAKARPLIGQGAYVNYADPDLTDWSDAYWGGNYTRLRQVKSRYDGDRVFDFPQAVQP